MWGYTWLLGRPPSRPTAEDIPAVTNSPWIAAKQIFLGSSRGSIPYFKILPYFKVLIYFNLLCRHWVVLSDLFTPLTKLQGRWELRYRRSVSTAVKFMWIDYHN